MKCDNTNTLGFLLHDATRLIRRRFELRGQAFGLSSAQWRLLVHLVREGSASQARIAELLEIEPISVSRLVDRMEQAGWVERRASRGDQRLVEVHLTPAGRALGRRLARLHRDELGALRAGRALASATTPRGSPP